MKILVLNCGSSTVKFDLRDVVDAAVSTAGSVSLLSGSVDRLGATATVSIRDGDGTKRETGSIPDHHEAVCRIIVSIESRPVGGFDAVGHRVVHGGDRFSASVLIDEEILTDLESLCELAPLHNPASISGIRAARALLGSNMPMAAVFDTAFHRSLPEIAAVYAIPHELSEKHRIRRYGFHGIAHRYSMLRYNEMTGVPPDRTRIVTLHLGNGCSACAIRDGKSIDTSMGFTPLEGLVMGTRSGDLDPALVCHLGKEENLDFAGVEELLNKRSGLLGISGVSNDMRELTAAYETDSRARLAIDVFCYRARKYVGAYMAAAGGGNAVIFSGGIGEHSPLVRQKICANMEWSGLRLDQLANAAVTGQDVRISGDDSTVEAFVVHTNEELLIAQETARLIEHGRR